MDKGTCLAQSEALIQDTLDAAGRLGVAAGLTYMGGSVFEGKKHYADIAHAAADRLRNHLADLELQALRQRVEKWTAKRTIKGGIYLHDGGEGDRDEILTEDINTIQDLLRLAVEENDGGKH